jgi:hypothetical protein
MRASPATILREVRQGRLPCVLVAGEPHFDVTAAEAWIEELGRFGEAGREGRWARTARR